METYNTEGCVGVFGHVAKDMAHGTACENASTAADAAAVKTITAPSPPLTTRNDLLPR